jgi:hypothetical protein
MVLPRLDCSFGGVSSVHVWWDALEVDVVLFEGSLEFVGALIVEDVECWCVSVCLELFMKTGPGGGQFACLGVLSGFDRMTLLS